MGDPKDKKKAVKEALKAEKKAAKAREKGLADQAVGHAVAQGTSQGSGQTPVSGQAVEPPPARAASAGGMSPAERAAAAAERQVMLQQRRVLIAFLTLLVTLIGVLIAARPWRWGDGAPADPAANLPTVNTNSAAPTSDSAPESLEPREPAPGKPTFTDTTPGA